jgi:hypothetical protein
MRELIGEEPVDPTAVVNALEVYNAKVSLTARMDVAKLGAMESIEQKSLSIAIDNFAESRLVSMIKEETDTDVKNLHLDRLFSIKTEASTAWLLAVPNPLLGLSMTNAELQFALQIRLGHVVGEFRCSGDREHDVDRSGLEVLKCKKFQKVRHDAIASVVTNIARAAGEHPTRENLGLFGDGSQLRPGDVVLPNFNRGGKLVLDVRVTNNKQDTMTKSAPAKAGRAAAKGAADKMRGWKKHCEDALALTGVRVESKFTPLAVDVYGCWTADALLFFYELAKRRRDFTERDPEVEFRYVMQQVSMVLQRENAKILVAHTASRAAPVGEEEAEVFVLSEEEVAPRAETFCLCFLYINN